MERFIKWHCHDRIANSYHAGAAQAWKDVKNGSNDKCSLAMSAYCQCDDMKIAEEHGFLCAGVYLCMCVFVISLLLPHVIYKLFGL